MKNYVHQFLIVLLFINLEYGSGQMSSEDNSKIAKRFTDVYRRLRSKDELIELLKTELKELIEKNKDEVKQQLDTQKRTMEQHQTEFELLKEALERKQTRIDQLENSQMVKDQELKELIEQNKNEVNQQLNTKDQEIQKLESQVEDMATEVLELQKMTAPSSCSGFEAQGIVRNQTTFIDGDGANHGNIPVLATCTFPGSQTTFGEEVIIDVTECGNEPNCFQKDVSYSEEMMDQINNVKKTSSSCFQSWTFQCNTAPLKHPVNHEQLLFWKDQFNNASNPLESTPSKCDLKENELQKDVGVINDMKKLPITGITYGQFNRGFAKVIIGPLTCLPAELETESIESQHSTNDNSPLPILIQKMNRALRFPKGSTFLFHVQNNTREIAKNANGISTNKNGIASAKVDIVSNGNGIATNKNGIASAKVDIVSNENGIATNKNGIATNKNGIASAKVDIVSNGNGIATNKNGVRSNSNSIRSNSNAIASNDIDIVNNRNGISTNRNRIADMANPIVFSAIKDFGGTSSGSYISSYTKFLTNHGNAFSLSTGIFTAPRAGVYEFYSSTYGYDNGAHTIAVQKNNIDELKFKMYLTDKGINNDNLSFDWMMKLEQGDTVRLKATSGQFYCSSTAACVFNGKYIRKN